MLQGDRDHAGLFGTIHFMGQLNQTIDHIGTAGDQQRIATFQEHHVPDTNAVVKLAHQRRHLFRRNIVQGHNPHDQLIAFGWGIQGVERRPFAVFRRDHLQNVVGHADHRITIDIKHVEEKLVILPGIQRLIAAHGNLAFYRIVNNDGFPQRLTGCTDKFVYVRSFKIGGKRLGLNGGGHPQQHDEHCH
ncbi:hypothetical protein D3C78_1105360 [compost metagenome]